MIPLQLYMASPTSVDLMLPDATTYGVVDDCPIPGIESPDNCVVVDPPVRVVSPEVQAVLPDPLSVDGIDPYSQVLSILQN